MNTISFEDWLLSEYDMSKEEFDLIDKREQRHIRKEYKDYTLESE